MAGKRYQITVPSDLTREDAARLFSQMAADPFLTTPAAVTDDVLRLCHMRLRGAQPGYVPVDPDPQSQLNECFNNVKRRVAERGGHMELGWCLGEWPTIFVEAEHHAIWVAPDGCRVDVTRRTHSERNILFVPDPLTPHTPGVRRDNRRLAISKHPAVAEFLRLSEEITKAMGETVGRFVITRELFRMDLERGFLQLKLRNMTPRKLVDRAWTLARTTRADAMPADQN